MYTRSKKAADLTVPVLAAVAAVFGIGILAPTAGYAQNNQQKDRQKDKNMMRNIAIGAGAAAVYSGVKGNTTAALVLGAGAAYAGKKYEDARKAQNTDNNSPRYSYDYPRYEDNGYRNDDRGYRYDDGRRDPRPIRYNAPRGNQGNNGKHKGWSKKNKGKCDDD